MKLSLSEQLAGSQPLQRIALVMTYPYEAFSGGENAYINALRRYLIARGHRVDTIVSDVTRRRSNPLLRFGGVWRGRSRLIVRRGLGRSQWRLSYDPALLRRMATRLVGGSATRDEHHGKGEANWLMRTLRVGRYDAVILLFDAYTHAAGTQAIYAKVLTLRGFFAHDHIRLDELAAKVEKFEVPPGVGAALAPAKLIGLNSRQEAHALAAIRPAGSVIVVGMGFEEHPPLPDPTTPAVLFVGADTEPNRTSLRWFLDFVWPSVIEKCVNAQLRIVGSVGRVLQESEGQGVHVRGMVASIEAEYHDAQVVVAPLVFGSLGVKTKVAEALSFGRPLVTTSLGVDPGQPDQFGEAVAIADTTPEFAEAVVQLLMDADLRAKRASQSLDAFRRNFSDKAAYGQLAEALRL